MMQNKKLPTVEWSKKLDIQGGTQPPRSQFIDAPKEGYIRLIQIRDFESEKYVTYVPKTSKLKTCNKEDLFIARYGASIGRILRGLEGAYNVALAKVILKDDTFNKDFLYYFLQSNLFQNHIHRISSRSAQSGFNKNDLASIPVPNPFIKEQQKIAAILSSVDEAIEKTEQIIEQTEKVKKGLMQELLTKGIGYTEFKDCPVGKIPQKWEVAVFNDVFDRITTKNSEDNKNVLTISGEHGLISQLEYFNKSVSAKSLTNYIYLENGDFAYNKSYSNGYPLGAIKRLERYEAGVVSTLYICFRLKAPNINGFYKYYFDSPYWHRQVYSIAPEGGRSHGLLNVGVKDFFEILIPVPPVEEQMMIERKLASIDEKVIIEKDRLNNLQTLKQGLMQELLTGKKRVKVDDGEEVLS